MSYLNEAFKALSALNEDTFSLSDDGIKKLSEFEQNDDLSDDISVIDIEAETEDELQDSYVGKVILDCSVCHSKLYKDKEEVTLDEEGLLANVGEECPYCYTSDGFKVIGEVTSFDGETETEEDEETEPEVEEDEELEESLNEGIFDKFKKKKGPKDYALIAQGGTRAGMLLQNLTAEDAEEQLEKYKKLPDKRTYNNFKIVKMDSREFKEAQKKTAAFYEEPRNTSKSIVKRIEHNGYQILQVSDGTFRLKGSIYNDVFKSLDDAKSFIDRKARNNSKSVSRNSNPYKDHIYNPVTDHYYTESLEEEYSEKYIIVARTKDGNVFYYDSKNDHLTSDIEEATQYAEEFIAEDDLAMISKNCKNDFAKIELEKVPQLDLLNKDTMEEAVGTLERPMSKLEGTLGSVLTAHQDELSKIQGRADALAFLDSIEPEVKNKGYLAITKAKIAKLPDYKAVEILYNIILKGDGMGAKLESLNNVNVETDDATVYVSQDDNGTVTVQTTPKNDGTDPVSDETIVPLSDETQTEIENNTGDEEEVEIPIDEFDEESFDELGESYLKRIYENVDSYHTTDISNYNNQIKVEGVIKFDSGNEKKTSFIFESKDCTKSGKLRFIGENVEITSGKKAFTITGSLNEKKFITESFNYNYKATNEDGTSSRIYGTLRKGRASK